MHNYNCNTLLLRHFVRQAMFVAFHTTVIVLKIVAVITSEIMPCYVIFLYYICFCNTVLNNTCSVEHGKMCGSKRAWLAAKNNGKLILSFNRYAASYGMHECTYYNKCYKCTMHGNTSILLLKNCCNYDM